MWKAYWQFAFKYTELYKLMFGIQVSCPKPEGKIKHIDVPRNLFAKAIAEAAPYGGCGAA